MRFARLRLTILLSIVISAGTVMPVWGQQFDPRQVVQQVILQLQTGTLNPSWYGVQLWQRLRCKLIIREYIRNWCNLGRRFLPR
jgi:hypothetical protein